MNYLTGDELRMEKHRNAGGNLEGNSGYLFPPPLPNSIHEVGTPFGLG